MKAIFFVSFCVAMLMVNFVNAKDKPQKPVGLIGFTTITSRLYPGIICTCTASCDQKDAEAIMARVGECEESGPCKLGSRCHCADHRCLWKQGENHETFTVKMREYPLFECQCTKKGCNISEGRRRILEMVLSFADYGGSTPCRGNGFCHCRRFRGEGEYAYPTLRD